MKYRERPALVEAMQYDGDNAREICLWADPTLEPYKMPAGWWLKVSNTGFDLAVAGAQGTQVAEKGDWIIKDLFGFYVCRSDIFAQTYEAAA